jgi:lipid-A-disaccharide synthase
VRRAADRVLLVFPFEQQIYDRAGIGATYVGHPLAQAIPMQSDAAAARRALDLSPDGKLVAVLPGSRRAEIEYIAPPFLRAIEDLARTDRSLRFVIPAASAALRARIETLAARLRDGRDRTTILEGNSHEAMAAADVVLVASGTATLEAALFKRPMVIAYRMPWLSALLMLGQGNTRWVGLPNILLQDDVVPELLQHHATPAKLAAAVRAQLDDERGRQRLVERFSALHEALRRDTPALAADAILEVAARRPG